MARELTIKNLLDLNHDTLLIIFELVNFNFCLINKQCEAICEYYDLTDETFVYESVNILKWGLLNGYKLSRHSLNDSIKYSNLDVIKYLIKRGYLPNEKSFELASKNKDFETMKWFKEIDCSWNEMVLSTWMSVGRMDILYDSNKRYFRKHEMAL